MCCSSVDRAAAVVLGRPAIVRISAIVIIERLALLLTTAAQPGVTAVAVVLIQQLHGPDCDWA